MWPPSFVSIGKREKIFLGGKIGLCTCMKLVEDLTPRGAESKNSCNYTSSHPHDVFGVYLNTGKILHLQYQPPPRSILIDRCSVLLDCVFSEVDEKSIRDFDWET
jgi:hypothetical protein